MQGSKKEAKIYLMPEMWKAQMLTGTHSLMKEASSQGTSLRLNMSAMQVIKLLI